MNKLNCDFHPFVWNYMCFIGFNLLLGQLDNFIMQVHDGFF